MYLTKSNLIHFLGPIAGISTSDDRSRPGTPSSSNSGASQANVAGGGSRPVSPTASPRQPEYPRLPNVGSPGMFNHRYYFLLIIYVVGTGDKCIIVYNRCNLERDN